MAVAYLAFSNVIVGGVWKQVDANNRLVMSLLVIILLAFVPVATHLISRLLGFTRENEIALVFCGSKMSMGSGLPMANIIFDGQAIGLIVMPMMIYYQIQLIVCVILARAFATGSASKGISG